jgi:altronate hydrolase
MLRSAPVAILLNPADDVMIACLELEVGTQLPGTEVRCAERIPSGHKIALRKIEKDQPVRRYNQIIGFASQPILPGQHVHTQNLAMRNFERDYAYGVDYKPTEFVSAPATWEGFLRDDGRAATRNYIGVISTVNCSATVVKQIAQHINSSGMLRDFPNVDGIVPITHGSGCGMASIGEGIEVLRRTLAGYSRHPNFAGVLMVGLGCEANQMGALFFTQGMKETPLLRATTIQDTGGTSKTTRKGVDVIKEMLPYANKFTRQTRPANELILGLECGGSDSYSGITANPALGAAVDLLVKHGGTATLAETPEVYGAEHLLTRRAVSKEIGEKLINRIHWWEDYTARLKGDMDNNPSPGNKAGGLTTILEKSLGAAAKGGTTGLMDVFEYAMPITAKGFTFMDTPGYDPCSVTGMVAGGANMVCFTTGRGSAFGSKPVPSLKLATNTPMFEHQEEDMDINCGDIVDGSATVQEVGERIFKLVLATASGQKSKSEAFGYGDEEFVPWILGATM